MSLLLSFIAFGVLSVQAATISGVVKENDSTGAAVDSAIVTLTATGGAGGAATLRDTVGAAGTFSFANVGVSASAAAPVTYRISAARTGYRAMTPITVRVTDSTATYTENLYLVATGTVITAKISGTVFDSASGTPATTGLAGAKVIIASRFGVGGGGATRDTVTTDADGGYAFDSVATGTYTLTVSASGHTTQTANATVTTATAQVINIKLLQTEAAAVSGTVSDSSMGTGIDGAKVYLLTRGGAGAGAIIDSTVTANGGAYTLGNVTSNANYTVRAVATDYVTGNMNITLTGTTAQTVNIKLVPIVIVSIMGTVTDSSAGVVSPMAGVKITLRSGATVVDSATTGSDGTYTLTNVQRGVAYTVRAEYTGYVTMNTNITGAAQTVNFRLVKIPTGNLIISIKTRADSTPVNGASVTATIGTAILPTGTTGTDGIVSYSGVNTGTYAISITAANFNPISSNTTLTANANDTVKIYLVAATAGTKMLKGVVKDSSTSALLSLARVELVITGAGAGGVTLTLVDSTDANGAYSFIGLPATRNTGRITVTLAGYRTFTNNALAIGKADTADTTTYNVLMVTLPVGVMSSVNHTPGIPDFNMASKGILRLSNISDAGVVKVFGMNGKILYQSVVNARTTSLALPVGMVKAGSVFIVSVTQPNAIYRKQIMMP